MLFYDDNQALIWSSLSVAATAVLTYLTKDRIDNAIKKQGVKNETGSGIIKNAGEVVNIMKEILDVLKTEKNDCQQALEDVRKELTEVRTELDEYKKRFCDIEAKIQ